MGNRILVIEDDPAIGSLLEAHLAGPGLEVALQRNGECGLRQAAAASWDLYIVDRMLPDMDGLYVCRRLREADSDVPVIFLTARDTEADRVAGLDAGADDYVSKPFGIAEIKARVRAQLRRRASRIAGGHSLAEMPLRAGAIRIDPRTREVQREGVPIALTSREFWLLHHLMCHRDRAWTREQLLDRVWGPGFEGFAHTVNSHINRLRAKLEAVPAEPRLIVTVWGMGYRFMSGIS